MRSIDILNRLGVIHKRSLPRYLSYAVPWGNNREGQATLARIASDQEDMADRISTMILESDGDVAGGEFPMEFTGYHDLSFDFLLHRIVELQEQDIAVIEACLGALNDNPLGRALAEESLGMAKGHLDDLKELAS